MAEKLIARPSLPKTPTRLPCLSPDASARCARSFRPASSGRRGSPPIRPGLVEDVVFFRRPRKIVAVTACLIGTLFLRGAPGLASTLIAGLISAKAEIEHQTKFVTETE